MVFRVLWFDKKKKKKCLEIREAERQSSIERRKARRRAERITGGAVLQKRW